MIIVDQVWVLERKASTCFSLYRLEQQYRYIYFNQVNLAVKLSLFSKRSAHNTITADIMNLISDISAEY